MLSVKRLAYICLLSCSFFKPLRRSPKRGGPVGEIPHASTRSLVRVVAGTMWGVGSQLALHLIYWLSWGARVRSVAPRSQQLWLNPTFPRGVPLLGHALGGKPHMFAPPSPLLFIKKKKKKTTLRRILLGSKDLGLNVQNHFLYVLANRE